MGENIYICKATDKGLISKIYKHFISSRTTTTKYKQLNKTEMLWGGRWEGGSCWGTHVRITDFKIKKNKKTKNKKKEKEPLFVAFAAH